jgi:hypothetical protein
MRSCSSCSRRSSSIRFFFSINSSSRRACFGLNVIAMLSKRFAMCANSPPPAVLPLHRARVASHPTMRCVALQGLHVASRQQNSYCSRSDPDVNVCADSRYRSPLQPLLPCVPPPSPLQPPYRVLLAPAIGRDASDEKIRQKETAHANLEAFKLLARCLEINCMSAPRTEDSPLSSPLELALPRAPFALLAQPCAQPVHGDVMRLHGCNRKLVYTKQEHKSKRCGCRPPTSSASRAASCSRRAAS